MYIFKYIVYIKKFNGKTDVNESEIIFPRNYNKWIDGTISFIISIKKEKKKEIQSRQNQFDHFQYIFHIYIYSTWITSDQHMNSNKFTGMDYQGWCIRVLDVRSISFFHKELSHRRFTLCATRGTKANLYFHPVNSSVFPIFDNFFPKF